MEPPKVRFNKICKARAGQLQSSSAGYTVHTESKEVGSQKKCLTDKNKVKIKSVVPVKFPLKVLKSGRHVLTRGSRSPSTGFHLDGQFECPRSDYTPDTINSSDQRAQLLQYEGDSASECLLSITSELENPSTDGLFANKCLTDDKGIYSEQLKSCTDNLQLLNIKSSSIPDLQCLKKPASYTKNNITATIAQMNSKSTSTDIPTKVQKKQDYDCISIDDNDDDDDDGDDDIQILKIVSNSEKCMWNDKQIKECKKNNEQCKESKACDNHKIKNAIKSNSNKEVRIDNKENYSEKIMPNKVENILSTAVVPCILKDSTNAHSTNVKSENNSKNSSSNRLVQVMPCAKFRISSSTKTQTVKQMPEARIKKKTLLDVTAGKCNVSVQAGPLFKNHHYKSDNDILKTGTRKSTNYKDALSYPEYNSTVNVIKKLNEIRNEKFIDAEKLPPAYKNIIIGKVSTALEFLPSESVYKNLISLVDEDNDKFPGILTRSKDPEPRDKDIVPKLSDFYKPKFTGEYFVIANPIIREPDNVNICNDFKISNKILMWKRCRDSDY